MRDGIPVLESIFIALFYGNLINTKSVDFANIHVKNFFLFMCLFCWISWMLAKQCSQ